MIFTIEGNIGSGKTTILKELEALKFGKRHIVVYEQVKEWADMKDKDGNDILSLFYKDKIKYSYIFQSYVLFSRINHLVQTIKNNPDAVIICERCHLTDLYVFAKSLYESNDLSEIEWNVYNLWHKQLRELLSIRLDGIIYIKTDPEVCYERIKQRNRNGESGIPMDYLKVLDEKHNEWLLKHHNVNWSEDIYYDVILDGENTPVPVINIDGNIDGNNFDKRCAQLKSIIRFVNFSLFNEKLKNDFPEEYEGIKHML